MGSRSDWGAARARAPYADTANWGELLEEHPEVLHRIIADAYDVVLREEEKTNGTRRLGRRPKPSQVPIGDVVGKVFPQQYSSLPFTKALEDLIGDRSQRQFSRNVPCHQGTLSKLLRGEYEPDMPMMERLAVAGGQGPWYFREWRAQYVGALVTDALMSNPSTGVQAVRALRLLVTKET